MPSKNSVLACAKNELQRIGSELTPAFDEMCRQFDKQEAIYDGVRLRYVSLMNGIIKDCGVSAPYGASSDPSVIDRQIDELIYWPGVGEKISAAYAANKKRINELKREIAAACSPTTINFLGKDLTSDALFRGYQKDLLRWADKWRDSLRQHDNLDPVVIGIDVDFFTYRPVVEKQKSATSLIAGIGSQSAQPTDPRTVRTAAIELESIFEMRRSGDDFSLSLAGSVFTSFELALAFWKHSWQAITPQVLDYMKGEERTNFEIQQIIPYHLRALSSPSGLAIQKASIYGIRSKPKSLHLAGMDWMPVAEGSQISLRNVRDADAAAKRNFGRPRPRAETFRWTANNVAAANPDIYSRVMTTLTKKMQNVYAAYFVDDMTYEEVAAKFGITPGRVSQIISEIRRRFANAGLPSPRHLCDGRKGTAEQSL